MLCLALAACSRPSGNSVERIALLPFENLTGDASLDWTRDAGPAILAEEIAGSAHLFAIRAPTVSEAALAGASRLVHASVSRKSPQALHLEISVEDPARRKMIATSQFDGSLLFVVDALARTLDPAAKPFSTRNAEAIAAWGQGEFERAVTLDPDFGTSWSAWINQLARSGKADEALLAAEKGLGRVSLRSPLNKAQIELQAAGLRKDETARVAALNTLAGLAPNDIATAIALAELEQRLRNFAKAADWNHRVLAMDPGNAGALNALGYAEGEAGHLDNAAAALRQYGQQPNQASNALDSLGEVYFMNGRFADAEKYFSQASAKDPAFLDGAPLLKAAYARWLAKPADVSAADSVMRRYLDFRMQHGDRTVKWREATWLYSTGREKEAGAALAGAPPDQKTSVDRQLSVWRGEVKPPSDLGQLKAVYQSTNPAADGLIRNIYAAALLDAGKMDEARALLTRWPLPESAGDPMLQSLVYPQFIEMRRKLGMQ